MNSKKSHGNAALEYDEELVLEVEVEGVGVCGSRRGRHGGA